jgi:hypothetical protein
MVGAQRVDRDEQNAAIRNGGPAKRPIARGQRGQRDTAAHGRNHCEIAFPVSPAACPPRNRCRAERGHYRGRGERGRLELEERPLSDASNGAGHRCGAHDAAANRNESASLGLKAPAEDQDEQRHRRCQQQAGREAAGQPTCHQLSGEGEPRLLQVPLGHYIAHAPDDAAGKADADARSDGGWDSHAGSQGDYHVAA